MSDTKLQAALDAVAADIPLVSSIRENPVVKRLIEAFSQIGWVGFNPNALLEEMAELSASVTFDRKAMPLEGSAGLVYAKKSRLRLNAARERLVTISRDLRQGILKTSMVLRVGTVHIRQLEEMSVVKTAKHIDDVCAVVLREVVECQDVLKTTILEIRETLDLVDNKTKELDAWFALHKQYVYMTTHRGPHGDQEEKGQGSTNTRQLGRRSGSGSGSGPTD